MPLVKTSTWSFPSIFSRNIFRAHEALLGRPTFGYWAELERTQYLTCEEIKRLQLKRLRKLLSSALHHCPWHAERIRKAGIDPKHLTWDEFKQLPLMDKEDARRHGNEMVWKDAPGGIYRYNTGGSTGEPLIFYFGRKRQAVDAACRMRARKWWGLEPGDREVFLWGAPTELNRTDKIKQIRDRLCNQLLLNAFEMSEHHMANYIDILNAYQPKCIYGYASSLALLAEYSEKEGKQIKIPQLKVVCTTGEPLYPHQRELLTRIFNVPVANEYGARDAGLMALESPQGQMLVNSEWIIIELLNNKNLPVADGEIGEVTITNLASEVQPFIRYRTGDMAKWSSETCQKGRGLNVLKEISGRQTDFIIRSDGTVMHALSLIYVVRDIPGVRKFRIIQKSPKFIKIKLVRNPKHWTDDKNKLIAEGIRKRLGNDVDVTIDIVNDIVPDKSGKYRYVVSHIKHS
ncbi:MAG: capsule biosynthesis protein CapK [Methylothermaceae bacteria B42]|nr:MAG: capsule biosynthesis protein CapK [Methylothermaceae bacteria B42]HHJ37924.1 phenylacetate--CoA ligase family protein [Methylothermaceae bacterium]